MPLGTGPPPQHPLINFQKNREMEAMGYTKGPTDTIENNGTLQNQLQSMLGPTNRIGYGSQTVNVPIPSAHQNQSV